MRTPNSAQPGTRRRPHHQAGIAAAVGALVAATVALTAPGPVTAAPTHLHLAAPAADGALPAPAWAGGAVAVPAVTPAPNTPLFTDDFEDGDAAGWSRAGGQWSVVTDGSTHAYRQRSGSAATRASAGDLGWTDYGVTARVKPTAFGTAQSWAGLLARVNSNTNYYYLALRSNSSLELGRVQAGRATVLADSPVSVIIGSWHTLRLTVVGSTLTGVLGTTTVTATDAHFPAGRIALATSYAAATFDDVAVATPAPAPDTQRPTAPGQPQVIEVTPTTATITWAPATDNVGVTQYWIYQGDQFYNQYITRIVSSAVPTVLPLSPTGAYLHFAVAARDAAGNMSAQSARTSIPQPPSFPKTGDETEPPSAPGAPVVTGRTDDGQYILTWTPSTDNVGVVEYHVYHAFNIDEVRVEAKVPTNTAIIRPFGGSYETVRVVAYDAAWNSRGGPSTSLAPIPPITTPPATP
nr:fibronectin type III domain-containing protein [Micromonospora sp. DSM 115978]